MTQTDKVEWVSSFVLKQFCLHALLFTVNSMMCYSQDCPLCLIFHMTTMLLHALLGTMKHSPEDTAKKLSVFPQVIRLACDSFLQLDEVGRGGGSGTPSPSGTPTWRSPRESDPATLESTLPVGWVWQSCPQTTPAAEPSHLSLCVEERRAVLNPPQMPEPPILLSPESFPLIQDFMITFHYHVTVYKNMESDASPSLARPCWSWHR